MKGFRYWGDAVFLASTVLYVMNRWIVKPGLPAGEAFFHGYFSDLLLIPCALPPALWLHRRLGLRRHDGPPQPIEVVVHLVLWSVLFEWWGPMAFANATGDWWDVACYWLGGAIAWWIWRALYASKPALEPHDANAS